MTLRTRSDCYPLLAWKVPLVRRSRLDEPLLPVFRSDRPGFVRGSAGRRGLSPTRRPAALRRQLPRVSGGGTGRQADAEEPPAGLNAVTVGCLTLRHRENPLGSAWDHFLVSSQHGGRWKRPLMPGGPLREPRRTCQLQVGLAGGGLPARHWVRAHSHTLLRSHFRTSHSSHSCVIESVADGVPTAHQSLFRTAASGLGPDTACTRREKDPTSCVSPAG